MSALGIFPGETCASRQACRENRIGVWPHVENANHLMKGLRFFIAGNPSQAMSTTESIISGSWVYRFLKLGCTINCWLHLPWTWYYMHGYWRYSLFLGVKQMLDRCALRYAMSPCVNPTRIRPPLLYLTLSNITGYMLTSHACFFKISPLMIYFTKSSIYY
jgi:hypothetical protein